jgi:hypothetical protein
VRKYKQEERQWRATGTRTCASTVSASTTDRKIAEPGFKTNSPVRMPEAENIGQGNTLMRKRLKDLSHQFRRSQTTSHHLWEADQC